MAQLCLYLEDDLMARIKEEASQEHVSLSKYVRDALTNRPQPESKWPESFWDTFGALSDPSFVAPDELDFNDDAPRLAFD